MIPTTPGWVVRDVAIRLLVAECRPDTELTPEELWGEQMESTRQRLLDQAAPIAGMAWQAGYSEGWSESFLYHEPSTL